MYSQPPEKKTLSSGGAWGVSTCSAAKMINVHKKSYSYIADVFDEVKRFFEFLKRHEYKALRVKSSKIECCSLRKNIDPEWGTSLSSHIFNNNSNYNRTMGLILEERKQVPRLFLEMFDSRNIHELSRKPLNFLTIVKEQGYNLKECALSSSVMHM